jgi:hypothetical protein
VLIDTVVLQPGISVVTPNPNSSISVSGTGEIGSVVTITFPDSTTAT